MGKLIVAGIIAVAITARAFLIWLTRPDFVGWFNHSYYYWVQVRGLLTQAELPFADLPLLFYLYAALASVLQWFGLGMEPAIINASRLVMCVVPALIALPVFLILRRMNNTASLSISQWLIVAMSAFLPLTLTHMPEMLQKNVLGMLLLMSLMYASYAALLDRSLARLLIVCALFVLIAVTHLGTLAVAILLGVSMLLSIVYVNAAADWPKKVFALLVAPLAVATLLVYVLDAAAFDRILQYAASGLPNSMLGGLFAPTPITQKALLALGIAVPLIVTAWMLRVLQKHQPSLQSVDRIFWRSCIYLNYLLVCPAFDLEIVPRLVLFMPLPMLIIINYHIRFGGRKRFNQATIAVAVCGISAMAVGDTTSLIRLYPDKEATLLELVDLRDRLQLGENDFVLTTYAVNPICNWFLGTQAGLITSFNKADFGRYSRLFILNPADGRSLQGLAKQQQVGQHRFHTDREKYQAMRLNIPTPADLAPLGSYAHFSFYELKLLPADWEFDFDGYWVGADYSAQLAN